MREFVYIIKGYSSYLSLGGCAEHHRVRSGGLASNAHRSGNVPDSVRTGI